VREAFAKIRMRYQLSGQATESIEKRVIGLTLKNAKSHFGDAF